MERKKLEVIVEKSDGMYWVRIERKGGFSPNNAAETRKEAIDGLRAVIADYQEHEGQDDKFWSKVDSSSVVFEIHADLQAVFEEHNFVSISAVADRAGLNQSLVRQYARGIKHPSEEQAKRIEKAIHAMGKELSEITIYA